MALVEGLRRWFSKSEDDDILAERGGTTTRKAVDDASIGEGPSLAQEQFSPSSDSETTSEKAANALPVANGQELLGPCRECDGFWTRELTRGQKPLTCPVCKRDGPPA